MVGTRDHYIKNNPGAERQVPHDLICAWNISKVDVVVSSTFVSGDQGG
jgi:hypothetical protein